MTRSREGRTHETCENLVQYFIGRLVLNKGHHDLNDLDFAESFNHALNGYPKKGEARDVSNDWTPEEVTALLAELMTREKADFPALRRERSHIPINEWRAIDSAIVIAMGVEGIEGREERRRRMSVHAEYIKEVERVRNMRRKAAVVTTRKPKGAVVLRLGSDRRPKAPKRVAWTMDIPVRLNAGVKMRTKGKIRCLKKRLEENFADTGNTPLMPVEVAVRPPNLDHT
ncbi:uncharacterized protein DNG_05543 [Cephalotrichum gorgonifer]|uniref:Uncharacterized protein n=1 Tax=Cephalotrichum gorgonifer TaxID=2041049 RepID=A0AAE8SVK7_9PEZI|nr:uncharacterized protein DNG_05543 [Cephalotrichum gorgonifer]